MLPKTRTYVKSYDDQTTITNVNTLKHLNQNFLNKNPVD